MAIWTIRTHYKKSCEQHEYFYNTKIPGARIIVKDGFRRAEFNIFTSDNNFPAIEFTEVPGGDGNCDSVDLFNLIGDNIDSTDLIEMFDGGCWDDIIIEGIDDDDEVERLRELINENGSWSLEDMDDSDWYLSDTECWVWGPLEIEDEEGNVRIICASIDGEVVDFVEEDA